MHDDGRIELRRVAYDWRAAAQAVRERVGELPARRIEQARFDPPVMLRSRQCGCRAS